MTIRERLELAVCSKDANAVETLLRDLWAFRPDDSHIVPVLCDLLSAHWHFRHEDVTLLLQKARDPRAAPALASAARAKFEYLNYDNSCSLARKCTWALADIGTVEAKQYLLQLSGGQDETIASYAKQRLDQWQTELGRKGQGA